MPTSICPGQKELNDYLVGRLSDVASDALAEHLDSCQQCQVELATLPDQEDTLVSRLREPTGADPYLEEPACHRALSRAKAEGEKGRKGEGLTPQLVPSSPLLPLSPSPLLQLPHQLGEYQLFEELGHGGMGTVYKARHTKLDRIVAVKVLPRGRVDDPGAIARFEREMKAIGQLNHPNVVQAYDAREVGGVHFLAMEFVEGLDLSEIVRRSGPLAIADACELVRQTAVGLQCAHEHGLVHRDIKPSNLMLAGQQVKILDLGLALLKTGEPADEEFLASHQVMAAAGEELTATHQGMGTASYMAPEQAGDAHRVDIRADIYGLGCTLYKLLSGHAPFPAAEHGSEKLPKSSRLRKFSQMLAHRTQPVEPIRQLRPEVPAELAAVINRMLAKAPADRFSTPAEVADALEPFSAGSDLASLLTESPAAHRSSPRGTDLKSVLPRGTDWQSVLPRHSPPATRWPRRLALAAGAAAAAILLGIIFTVSTGKGTVKLEFADAEAARQCKISIDGDDIRIENLGEPIKLRPGKHQLRILHGDLEIETREFDVVRHGAHILRVSIPATTEPPRTAKEYAARGRACYLKGEFSQAIAGYTEAIRVEPKVPSHYLGRGEVYAACVQPDRAIADFTEAIRLDPNDTRAWMNRGDVYFEQANLPKAEADFREALQISPDCARHCFEIHRTFRLTNQGERAAVEWRKVARVLAEYRQVYDTTYGFRLTESRTLDKVLGGFRERVRVSKDIDAGWLRWVSCWIPSVMQSAPTPPGIVFASDLPWVSSSGSAPGVAGAVRDGYAWSPNWVYGLPYYKGVATQTFADERPRDVVIEIGGRDFAAFKSFGGPDGMGSVIFEVLLDGKRVYRSATVRFPMLESIHVEVGAAKQIVLRFLKGVDGNPCNATLAVARFVRAGAEDPLEVPPAELQSATHANAALFLAEVHWRLDHKDLARRWFDNAAAWIDKHPAEAEKLRQYRAEAAKTIGGK